MALASAFTAGATVTAGVFPVTGLAAIAIFIMILTKLFDVAVIPGKSGAQRTTFSCACMLRSQISQHLS